jgi:hypothetical protein
MNDPLPQHLQTIVEALCETGCQNVNGTIELIENNGDVEEISGLTDQERSLVLNELKNIMSVYDEQDN